MNERLRLRLNTTVTTFIFWSGNEEHPTPDCVSSYEVLASEAMTPAKLRRHLETKHTGPRFSTARAADVGAVFSSQTNPGFHCRGQMAGRVGGVARLSASLVSVVGGAGHGGGWGYGTGRPMGRPMHTGAFY